MINNYIKIVGDKTNRIYSMFFFDEDSEPSLRDALTKAGLALRSPTEPSHLVMWRKPALGHDLLDKMRYSTPCPDDEHRIVTIVTKNEKTGKDKITRFCEACGQAIPTAAVAA